MLKQIIIIIIYLIQLIASTTFIFWGWKVNLNFLESMAWLSFEIAVGYRMFEWFRHLNEDYVKKVYEENAEREKQKQKKLHHSKIFVEKDLVFRKDTLVGFYDNNSLKLCIKGGIPSNIQPYDDYSEEVNTHLERGYYSEIWEHIIKRDAYIKVHNVLAENFLFNIIE